MEKSAALVKVTIVALGGLAVAFYAQASALDYKVLLTNFVLPAYLVLGVFAFYTFRKAKKYLALYCVLVLQLQRHQWGSWH